MEPFEYIVVLTSLILGLGIAQILTGVADILSHIRHVKISIPHAIYVLVVFLIHIQEWWINYQYSKIVPVWTLSVVLCILIFPILLFLQARMLFPTGLQSKETDLNNYYDNQWRWLFSIGTLTVAVSLMQNMYIQNLKFIDNLPIIAYLIIYLVFLLFNIKNKVLHIAFVSAQLLAWIIYIIVDDTALVI